MKNITLFGKGINPSAKRQLLFFIYALFGLFMTTGMSAQQAISIIWDSETGCLIYDDKRKEYVEDIYDGPCVRVCEHSTVTYSLTGDSSGWQNTAWNVVGGSIDSQTLTTCTVTWGSSGAGTVSAAVTKADDTVQTEEICVEIIISPTAGFGLMPDLNATTFDGCLDDTFYFVNTSQTNGGTELIAYYWDFGDGNTSPEFQPSHNYTHPGNYRVVLTVTNACNCTSSYEMKVNVGEGGFEIICPGVVCDGERSSYTIPDYVIDACASAGYEWSVVGGTIVSPLPYGPQILVDWDHVDATGFGYVMLDATHCDLKCAGISSAQIPVIQSKGTITGETVVCANEQNIYKLPQWPSTNFNWSLAAGSTGAVLIGTDMPNEVVVQTFGTSGTITLNAVYHNTLLNCGGTASITITIRPRAIIQGDRTLCINTLENYSLQGGLSGTWTLTGPQGTTTGSGSTFNHNFTIAGNYILTVSGSTFCRPGQLGIVVRDNEEAPAAIDGPDVACPGIPETFSVNNTIAGTQIVWDVMGGTINGTDHGNEISVTFDPTGPYSVSAWRESLSEPNCPSETITKTITLPVVDPNISGPQFACSSTYADYEVDYSEGEVYTWSISPANAGSVSSGNGTQQVTVLWNEYSGTANVLLTVTKCGIAYPQPPYPVQIITAPTISLVNPDTQVCKGEPLTLTLTSIPSLTSGTISWDFGDGTVITTNAAAPGGLTASHAYTPTNSSNVGYDITITVSGGNGCLNQAITTHQVIVLPAPVASISPGGNYSICPGMSPQVLTLNIQGGLSAVTNIQWYKAPSTPVGSGGVNYTASTYGSYYAVVTGTNGCTTTTNAVSFNGNCDTLPPCQTGETVVLNNPVNNCGVISLTASYTGTPTNVEWITPVNPVTQSTTNTSASFTYNESGSYTIFYRVTYGNCAVTLSKTIVVPYTPELLYTITCGTGGGYNVTLLDNSNYYPGHPITSHTFSIDSNNYPVGGGTSYTENLMPGTYTLGLTIDGNSYPTDLPCSVTPITIVLPELPTALFTHDAPRCEDAVISFTADDIGSGLSYHWSFGDGASNLQQDPERVYEAPQDPYQVTLTVTNQYGCSVSHSEDITIIPNTLEGDITASADTACQGAVITLTYNNQGIGIPQTYYWMKGNQQIGTTTHPDNDFDVTASGSYWVKIESAQGCLLTDILPVTVTFINAPVAHISGPNAVCRGNAFTLSVPDAGSGALYEWRRQPNTTIISTQHTLSQTLSSLGSYTYEVIVKIPDGLGGYCTNTDTHSVTVNQIPGVPHIDIALLDCETYTFELTANASGSGTFTWSNGMSGPVIQVTQGGAYQVTFTNPSGCSSSTQIDIPYDPAVHLWSVPDGCYTLCKEALYAASLTGTTLPIYKWEWLHNSSSVANGMNSPVSPLDISPYGSGTFQLILNSGYCDRESEEVHIETIEDCKCDIRIRVRNIRKIEGPYCAYEVILAIDNPYGMPVQVNLTLPNGEGIFVPSTVTANPGSNTFAVNMISLNGFSGGVVTLYAEALLDAGRICLVKTDMELPACGNGHRMAIGNKTLTLSPNPANDHVDISYHYDDIAQTDGLSLEIYSLMGVLLESYRPQEATGVWKADLGRYPSGQYIVVMKLNGEAVIQKQLILQ